MQKEIESLMNSANNLYDLVVSTEKHATTLCGYIADLSAGDDKNEYVKESKQLSIGLCSTRRRSKRRFKTKEVL